MTPVTFAAHHGDVLEFEADVLALKYARRYHGVAEAVSKRLKQFTGQGLEGVQPHEGEAQFVVTEGALHVPRLLVIGTRHLWQLDYAGIREFGYNAVAALRDAPQPVAHLAMTLHGASYGLDAREAFRAEVLGVANAINNLDAPPTLERVSFVELSEEIAGALRDELAALRINHPSVRDATILSAEPPAERGSPGTAPRDQVFISYARADESIALRLADDLTGAGIRVWIDQINLQPGVRWDRAIQQALTESRVMVLVLTKEATRSDNVADEYHYFLTNAKDILPILAHDFTLPDMPYRLSRFQYIDFRESYADSLPHLLEALHARLKGGR